jgi:hypothetical protein
MEDFATEPNKSEHSPPSSTWPSVNILDGTSAATETGIESVFGLSDLLVTAQDGSKVRSETSLAARFGSGLVWETLHIASVVKLALQFFEL